MPENQVQQYEKVLENAQYRKTLSIAFFNATNSAIEMVKTEIELGLLPVEIFKEGEKEIGRRNPNLEERLEFWKDHFLKKHLEYYALNVAPSQTNYDVKESLSKLKIIKSPQDLIKVWQDFSEDERHDKRIIAEVKKLKKKYKISGYKPRPKDKIKPIKKNEKTQRKTKK